MAGRHALRWRFARYGEVADLRLALDLPHGTLLAAGAAELPLRWRRFRARIRWE